MSPTDPSSLEEPANPAPPEARPAITGNPTEWRALFREYAAWASRPGPGRERLDAWPRTREAARRHYETLVDADRHARDVTEAALWKLLPHEDDPVSISNEAFVCRQAPAVRGDLRGWFEGAGWARPENWPALGRGLFEFVVHCHERPTDLWQAVEELMALPGARALSCGMLSPILAALRPSEFVVVHGGVRVVLNHLTGGSFRDTARDYPGANAAARRIVADIAELAADTGLSQRRPEDVFECFCHWVVQVRMMRGGESGGDGPATSAPTSSAPNLTTPVDGLVEVDHREAELVPSTDEQDEARAPDRGDPAPGPEPHATVVAPPAALLEPLLLPEAASAEVSSTAETSIRTTPAEPTPPEAAQRLLPPVPAPALAPAPAFEDEPWNAPAGEPPAALAAEAPAAELDPAGDASLEGPPEDPDADWIQAGIEHLATSGLVVLAGRAGCGAARRAERLATAWTEGGDGEVEHLVFHAGWRYADFIQAADADGARHPGRFTAFCRRAATRRARSALVIHEVQRAPVAEVLGEALVLLERRGLPAALAGGGTLEVPGQVAVIVTLDLDDEAGELRARALMGRFPLLRVSPG